MLAAIIAGGKVTLCTQCAVRRGIKDGDQINGIVIAGAASFVEEILTSDVQALIY
jgi:predicted peroxiredoxin